MLTWYQMCFTTELGQHLLEGLIPFPDVCAAGNIALRLVISKPVPHNLDRNIRVVVVDTNVLPRDVRDELLVAVWFLGLQRGNCCHWFVGRCPEQTELKGHIEAGEAIDSIETRPGNIMIAESAFLYDASDLVYPDFSCVGDFECGPRDKAAIKNREDDSIKYPFIRPVKRAVKKDIVVVSGRSH